MGTGSDAAPSVIGVAGAGTMGAGIAQLACQAGARTLLHDPDEQALERGIKRIADQLQRSADRGRLTTEQAERARELLVAAPALEQLAPCELVIEASPERLEIKRQLFARLAEIVDPGCVLATNTSSLLVTAMADAAGDPSRVVGMHFFNPPPVMRLLEVVAGAAIVAAGAGGRPRRRRGDGQTGDRRRRRSGVHCEPLQPAVWARGAEAATGAGGDDPGDRRGLPTGWRLPDGAV